MKRFVSTLRILLALTLSVFSSGVTPVATAFAAEGDSHTVSNQAWTGLGSENEALSCQTGQTTYWHWILTPGGNNTLVSASLTVHYTSGATTTTSGTFPSGGGNGAMHFDVYRDVAADTVSSASVTYTYTEGTNSNGNAPFNLTISSSACQGEPTPPPTPENPLVVATPTACSDREDSTGTANVTVTNVADATHASATYTVAVSGAAASQQVTLADGAHSTLTFTGLAVGSHTVTVTGSDQTTASTTVTIALCETPPPPTPETPVVTAEVLPCQENTNSTDGVKVTVTNTDDATNAAVTYTASVKVVGTNAVVATHTFTNVADGASANYTFNGLAAGTYYVSIVGSDETTAHTSNFTVHECKKVPCGDECIPPETKIDICHATGSESHPYQLIRNISVSGVYNGHLDDNYGGIHGDHQNGEDIIPPFEYNGHTYSQNWPAGREILDNNCIISEEDTDVQVLVPCVEKDHTTAVTIRVYNNNDHALTYTVTVEQPDGTGTNHLTAEVPALGSHDFTFSGYGIGTFDYTVTQGEKTVISHNFTVALCTTPPPPVDVCLNLPGNQTEVPAGYVKDGNNCAKVLGETDVCPNIAGTQASVPAGMVKDQQGNCVTPAGGQGAGQVLGVSQVLGAASVSELPNTGPTELPSPLLSVIAGFFAYLFLSRRNRKAEA